MSSEEKLVNILSNVIIDPSIDRKIYFVGTEDEQIRFVKAIENIHKGEKIAKQNEYFKTKWNNRNEKSN